MINNLRCDKVVWRKTKTKQSKNKFNQTAEKLQLAQSNIRGLVQVSTHGGHLCLITLIDDIILDVVIFIWWKKNDALSRSDSIRIL